LFEDDLGITGDDGIALLEATEKRFGVQLSLRETFNLGPNEFLFNGEGLGPDIVTLSGGPTRWVRPFTVGDLYQAVQNELTRRSQTAD
jgi:hypothetical protein